MTIALRGNSDITYTADGGISVAWPSGVQAGDTALLFTATSGGRKPATSVPAGWTLLRSNSAGEAIYGRLIITPADLALAVPVNAVICGMVVLSGVSAFGATSSTGGITLPAASGAIITFGRRNESSPALTPPTGRIFATDAINPKYSSYKVKKKTHWRKRRYNAWLQIPGVAGFASISGSSDAMMSVELIADVLPAADASAMTPTTLTPANDATAEAGQIDFLWANPTAYAEPLWSLHQLQLRAVGAATWGSVSSGTWTPGDGDRTEVESAATGSQISSVLDSLAAGTYEWRIRAQFASSIWSAWSATSTFTVVAPPAVGEVAVEASLTPVVSWSLASGSQSYARVMVRDTLGEQVYDSGLQPTDLGSWVVPMQDWVNGGSYLAAVTVMSADGMQSAEVESSPFVVAWTPPEAPASLTLADGRPPQAVVTGLAGAALLRLEWLTTSGATATGVWPVTADTMTLDLPLLPYAAETTVSAFRSDVDGTLWSAPITADVTSYDTRSYLVDDEMGSWVEITIAEDDGLTEAQAVSASYPLGESEALVLRSDRAGDAGVVTLLARTLAEKKQIREWLRDRGTFWLRWTPEKNMMLGGTLQDAPPTRMAAVSPWREQRVKQKAIQHRTIPISWVERP